MRFIIARHDCYWLAGPMEAWYDPGAMQRFEELDPRRRRRYAILAGIILATLPCYCAGWIAIQRAPEAGLLATETPTSTEVILQSLTPNPTETLTPTITLTPSVTTTLFVPPSRTPTDTPTGTPTPTETQTPTATSIPTHTATRTPTQTATLTASNTPSPTGVPPTATFTPTDTPLP